MSLSGWGSIWRNTPVQGKWFRTESCLPINILELRAIRLSLLHFSKELKGCRALVCTDDVAEKAHLNKQGGLRSSALHKKALKLFSWAVSKV